MPEVFEHIKALNSSKNGLLEADQVQVVGKIVLSRQCDGIAAIGVDRIIPKGPRLRNGKR